MRPRFVLFCPLNTRQIPVEMRRNKLTWTPSGTDSTTYGKVNCCPTKPMWWQLCNLSSNFCFRCPSPLPDLYFHWSPQSVAAIIVFMRYRGIAWVVYLLFDLLIFTSQQEVSLNLRADTQPQTNIISCLSSACPRQKASLL